MISILFRKRFLEAVIPTRGTSDAAGFDLTVVGAAWEPDQKTLMCDTGLNIAFPPGYVLKVFPRSGLARKHGMRLTNGVGIIDADYRGPLMVMLQRPEGMSMRQMEEIIQPGVRIAQCILEKLPEAEWIEVDELPDSVRGENGFGSTGTR